jgi:hypothetical protein
LKAGEVEILERINAETPLERGVSSWPWVTLMVVPEEREASLQALESRHMVFY